MDYRSQKIVHLKRAGLVSNNRPGIGMNGGAAPDWLVEQQEADRKKAAAKRDRQHEREFAHRVQS